MHFVSPRVRCHAKRVTRHPSPGGPAVHTEGLEPRLLFADVLAPTAILKPVEDILTSGGTGCDVVVTIRDAAGVDDSSIGITDLKIRAEPDLSPTLKIASATIAIDNDPTTCVVTYRVEALGAVWDAWDNDAFAVTLLDGEVADTSGNHAPLTLLGGFRVAVPTSEPYAAEVVLPDLTEPSASYSFSVTYEDVDGEVVRQSIDRDDVYFWNGIVGLPITSVSVSSDVDARTLVATYTAEARRGAFVFADNGEYFLYQDYLQVRDQDANYAKDRLLGSFKIDLPAPVDPPTAELQPLVPVGHNEPTYSFTVAYLDAGGEIDVSTIDAADVVVTGTNTLEAAGVSVDVANNGPLRLATYTVAAPGGTWDAADNGNYAVNLRPYPVADTARHFVPVYYENKMLGHFTVDFGTFGGEYPVLAAPDVTRPGKSSYEFTITYGADLNRSSLGDEDVVVDAAGGPIIAASLVSVKARTATYRIRPPGGTWDASDPVDYRVRIWPERVRDLSGNDIGYGTVGSFRADLTPSAGAAASLGRFGSFDGASARLVVDDADGTAVTFSLAGGGAGEAFAHDGRIDVVLDDATTADSALTITGKGGDGRVSLGNVTVGSQLRSFTAKTSDLTGVFRTSGPLKTLTLGDVAEAGMLFDYDGEAPGAIRLGRVSNLSIESESVIESLKVADWADTGARDVVSADAIGSVSARGDFGADVRSRSSLGSVKVGGALSGAYVGADDRVGKVAVGSVRDSWIYVGVSPGTQDLPRAQESFTPGVLGGVTVRGAFADSLIVGARVGKVNIRSASQTGTEPYGVLADRIGSAAVTVAGEGRVSLRNGDRPADGIVRGNFGIRLL